ncbi:hypothetical protein GGS21DRAFT_487609 [Xylaria nigripes]|nr:hypothetical protein GGS21DRAFT_487609 [Xylaria nigripes]
MSQLHKTSLGFEKSLTCRLVAEAYLDSDLEVFSHYPADGSVPALLGRTAAKINYPNSRFLISQSSPDGPRRRQGSLGKDCVCDSIPEDPLKTVSYRELDIPIDQDAVIDSIGTSKSDPQPDTLGFWGWKKK